jgi:hypothetical protein
VATASADGQNATVTPGAVSISAIVATASADGQNATVTPGAVIISGIAATASAEGKNATISNILAFITCSPAMATAEAYDIMLFGNFGYLIGMRTAGLFGLSEQQLQGSGAGSESLHGENAAQLKGVKVRNG